MQFNLDDDHVFTCVGTSGPSAPARNGAAAAAKQPGAGAAGAPGNASGVPDANSGVLLAAAAAMQGGKLAEAVRELAMRRGSSGQAAE